MNLKFYDRYIRLLDNYTILNNNVYIIGII